MTAAPGPHIIPSNHQQVSAIAVSVIAVPLIAVENEFNNRPRMALKDRTPAALSTALRASHNPPVLPR